MPDTQPPVFTTNALELIRDLASLGKNLNAIRSALFKQNGVWFRDDDIVMAIEDCGLTVTRTPVAVLTQFDPQNNVTTFFAERLKRPVDKVRLVKPGTFPVPVGGYRMGRRG